MISSDNLTQMLIEASQGQQAAVDKLMPLVYQELRRLAEQCLSRERYGHTLQATALVHEAYLKLIDQNKVNWHNRAHFFSIAARLMRRILADYGRNHNALKRGGHEIKITLNEAVGFVDNKIEDENINLTALMDALTKLANIDLQQSRLIELRFFAGLSVEETAAILGVSPTTVKRDWAMAKTWLRHELRRIA